MSRLPRFEEHRFVGVRDTMRVYDCDDPAQFEELKARVEADDLVGRCMIQTFGPDTLDEARNRGFEPAA
ncbi:MAG: hypothetical protein DIU67_006215 [Actinomycetes bacterium]|nr:MAG: hypothetical protein DIU67_02225 [Actinomycetota bacterium]